MFARLGSMSASSGSMFAELGSMSASSGSMFEELGSKCGAPGAGGRVSADNIYKVYGERDAGVGCIGY
jgi:hypothetical protein